MFHSIWPSVWVLGIELRFWKSRTLSAELSLLPWWHFLKIKSYWALTDFGFQWFVLAWNLADEVGMVEHTCSPSQAEAGGLPWTLCWKLELHSEFQASLCPGLLSEILALKRNLVSAIELSTNNISPLLATTFSSRVTSGQFIEGNAGSCSSWNLENLGGRMRDFSKTWLMCKRQALPSNLSYFLSLLPLLWVSPFMHSSNIHWAFSRHQLG